MIYKENRCTRCRKETDRHFQRIKNLGAEKVYCCEECENFILKKLEEYRNTIQYAYHYEVPKYL